MRTDYLLQGDALQTLRKLPDNSVDCVITSPPYYNLRDYGIDGQIGNESTVNEYLDRLVMIFSEVYRVLKPTGTLWLNIADSYNGSGKGRAGNGKIHKSVIDVKQGTNIGTIQGVLHLTHTDQCKRKDLIGVPWLLAFLLRDKVGFYLRQDIIWNKPNAMPESVKDRCTRSHEYIFLFSKSDKYYFDYKAIEEPAVTSDRNPPRGSKGAKTPNKGRRKQEQVPKDRYIGFNDRYFSKDAPLMRRKRDVWTVSTKGYKDAHFATFPPELIEPCVLAGCPENGTVLDPFAGSGTVGEVCLKHSRHFCLIELNPQYVDIIKRRLLF